MHLTPIKSKILEAMAEESKPTTPKDIAKKVGLNFSSCMMHILGLKKAGYISSPQKGYYQILPLGRENLKPRVSKEVAASLLSRVTPDKAFYFYTGINQYLGLHANSLHEFCEKIKDADTKAVEFHVARKDFERWLESLGDQELAKKIGTIRERATSGEELRRSIYEVTKARYDELASILKTS